MTTKLDKMARTLNNEFSETCDAAFLEKFGVPVTTTYNFWQMAQVTSRADGKKLPPAQRQFLEGYSDGYAAAMQKVRDA